LRAFSGLQDVSRAEKRVEADPRPGERVLAALLAIDDADGSVALEPGRPQGVDGVSGRAARRDDVLDEADPLAREELALELPLRAVALGLFPHDQERKAGGEGRGRRERDRPQLRAGDADGRRRDLADPGREPLAEGGEQVGPRLEAVLVEVIARPLAGAEDEVALEVRVLADPPGELGVREGVAQLRACQRTRRATGSKRPASSEPSGNVTIEPSA
jgi:hypothetical protein